MYSIKDIIKKSFLEGYQASDINFKTVFLAIAITGLIAVYLFILYRLITRKTFYSRNFNISLVGVAMITAAIIVTIQSSIVVSLGMVGALSIVRFRTAVKDPMDLMFLFWSISTGIMCGAGFAEYALILAFLLTVVIVVLRVLPLSQGTMLLIVNSEDIDNENAILAKVKEYAKAYKVKSRNITASALDMTIEIRTAEDAALVRGVSEIKGVMSATIVEHDGDAAF